MIWFDLNFPFDTFVEVPTPASVCVYCEWNIYCAHTPHDLAHIHGIWLISNMHTIKERYCIHRYYYYCIKCNSGIVECVCVFVTVCMRASAWISTPRIKHAVFLCTLFFHIKCHFFCFDMIKLDEDLEAKKNAHIWLTTQQYIKKFSTQFIYALIQYPSKMDFP